MNISIKRVQHDACIGAAEREKFGTQFKKYIFMAVAGMLALSSCSNDDNDIQDVQNAPRQMTFTADFGDGAQTRADLNFSTYAVTFVANDEISILSAKNTNTKFTTTAGGASATFSGTATDDSKFYAVYPYTAGLALSGDVISGVVIPSDQWNDKWGNYTEDESSWDPKAPIAYATTTGSSLQFHNLCAILKIRPYWGGDGWITISADQYLAGTFSLDTSTTPATLTAIAGSKTVTIGSSSGIMKRVMGYGSYLYIAIAPGSYTNFKVRTADVNGNKEKTKASVTFEAGKIYNLGDVQPY